MRSPFLLITMAVCLNFACTKNDSSGSAAAFYGTWIKGTQPGDTLWFMKKGGKDMLKYNMSFNPQMTNYVEVEYAYQNNKLSVATMSSTPTEISSFIWKEPNHSFQLAGYQLYMFMSSTLTTFTFVKQ